MPLNKSSLGIELRAGDLTLSLDPDIGFLRYIRLGDFEVCRAIWLTHGGQQEPRSLRPLRNLDLETTPTSFRAAAKLEGGAPIEILGESSGKVTIRPPAGGIAVLLPIIECAGKTCQLEQADGSIEAIVCPREMAGGLVFPLFRALTFEPAPGARIEIRSSSGTFDFQDQRGWGAASFRLSLESSNDAVITLSLLEPRRKILPVNQGRTAQVSIVTTPVFPKIKIGWQPDPLPFTQSEAEQVSLLRLHHLRAGLNFRGNPDFEEFSRFLSQLKIMGIPLQIAAAFSERFEKELEKILQLVRDYQARISLWAISLPENMSEAEGAIREKLASFAPNTFLALGPRNSFREFAVSPLLSWAVPCFALDQRFQPDDETTWIENLACQRMNVEGARRFSAQSAAVSATLPVSSGAFSAAWLVGSLSQLLTAANIQSLTYRGSFLDGGPVYQVLASLAGYDRTYPAQSTHPLQVAAVTLINPKEERRILLANFLPKEQVIKIKSGTARGRVCYFDQTPLESVNDTVQPQLIDPASGKLELRLAAHGVACIDLL